jgi:ABC-type transport system substrate-binding protein
VIPLRRTADVVLVATVLTLAVAACDASSVPSSTASPSTTAADLSAIACATDDPTDVGPLTGAWAGNDGGTYYIRQVGDCVWWFGTEVDDVEPAGQGGFANVASGRIDGTRIEVEWADIPLGTVMGGGGLSLVYDEETDQLTITEQRGDWIPFGAGRFTRIEPQSSPDASPSESG